MADQQNPQQQSQPTTDDNPAAARMHAMLHLAFSAESDEEWAAAQEQIKRIAAMSDEDVTALSGQTSDAGGESQAKKPQPQPAPQQHARAGSLLRGMRGD